MKYVLYYLADQLDVIDGTKCAVGVFDSFEEAKAAAQVEQYSIEIDHGWGSSIVYRNCSICMPFSGVCEHFGLCFI